MANSVGDNSSFINEEPESNIFDSSDNTVVANSDCEISDVNKSKIEVIALKIVVTEQVYIIKQSVGIPKTYECNCSSKNNIYTDSFQDQIHYLKKLNKIKKSIM